MGNISSIIVGIVVVLVLVGAFIMVYTMNKKICRPDGVEPDFLCQSCKSTGGCKFKI